MGASTLFNITKVLNNLKNNDYTVNDYKMCKEEADVVIALLEDRKAELEYETSV